MCEVFQGSDLNVDGLDGSELGLYLALNKTEEELELLGLSDFCPKRKTNRGRPPVIIGCAMDESEESRYKPWLKSCSEPNQNQIRRMRVILPFIMQNHIYDFDGELRRQEAGGPIGLELTGV